jgi:hypothetical protein
MRSLIVQILQRDGLNINKVTPLAIAQPALGRRIDRLAASVTDAGFKPPIAATFFAGDFALFAHVASLLVDALNVVYSLADCKGVMYVIPFSISARDFSTDTDVSAAYRLIPHSLSYKSIETCKSR